MSSHSTAKDAGSGNTAESAASSRPHEEDHILPKYEGDPIGVAVLGTGQRSISITIKLLEASGNSVKFVIYDEAEVAAKYFRQYHASWSPGNPDAVPELVDSVSAAVNHPSVKWVIVTSKNYLHKDYCIAALEAGKHVFCEKPLATTIDDCIAIKEAATKAGKLFMTGFVLRYSPFYSHIRSLVDEGFLGKIVSVEANEMLTPDHGGYIFRNWRRFKEQSGPHILEKCAHDIDIINWMVGSIATKVSAFGGTDIFIPENKPAADKLQEESGSGSFPMYKAWGAWEDVDPFTCEKSVEDNLVAIIQYRNGIRATFQTNCCSALSQRQLKILGVEGTVDADSIPGTVQAKRMARGSTVSTKNFKGGQHAGGDEHLVIELWAAIVHSVKKTDSFTLKSSLEECFISTITCLAIDEAKETGAVVDLEKYWEQLGV